MQGERVPEPAEGTGCPDEASPPRRPLQVHILCDTSLSHTVF